MIVHMKLLQHFHCICLNAELSDEGRGTCHHFMTCALRIGTTETQSCPYSSLCGSSVMFHNNTSAVMIIVLL